jgi:hypothetical protein
MNQRIADTSVIVFLAKLDWLELLRLGVEEVLVPAADYTLTASIPLLRRAATRRRSSAIQMHTSCLQISKHLGCRGDASEAFGTQHDPQCPYQWEAQRACTLPSLRIIEHGCAAAFFQRYRDHRGFSCPKTPFKHGRWCAADEHPCTPPTLEHLPGWIGLRPRKHLHDNGIGYEDSICQVGEQCEVASFGESDDR